MLCRFHWLSLAVTHCYLLPLVVTRCITLCHLFHHSLSFVVTRCTTHCQSLPFVVTRCHSLSFDVPLVCLFKNDLKSTDQMHMKKTNIAETTQCMNISTFIHEKLTHFFYISVTFISKYRLRFINISAEIKHIFRLANKKIHLNLP